LAPVLEVAFQLGLTGAAQIFVAVLADDLADKLVIEVASHRCRFTHFCPEEKEIVRLALLKWMHRWLDEPESINLLLRALPSLGKLMWGVEGNWHEEFLCHENPLVPWALSQGFDTVDAADERVL
jgi:hypothetical protein